MRITPQNFPGPERGRIFTSFCQHTFFWGKNSWLGGFNLPLVQSCNLVPAATLHLTITKKRLFLIIVKSLLCGIKNVVRWNYYYYVCLVCPGLEVKMLSFDRFVTWDIDNWHVERCSRGEFLVFLGGFLMGSVTMTEHLLLRWEIPATDAINLLESCSFHDPLSLHSCNDLHAGVDNKFA